MSAGGTAELCPPACASQVCCDTHMGVMDLRHRGEPFLSKDLLPLSLADTGRYSQSICEMVAQSWGDCTCLRVIYLILCLVPFSECILVLEPRRHLPLTPLKAENSEFQTCNCSRIFCWHPSSFPLRGQTHGEMCP